MTKNTEIEKKLKRVQWIRTVINHHLDDVEEILKDAMSICSQTTPKCDRMPKYANWKTYRDVFDSISWEKNSPMIFLELVEKLLYAMSKNGIPREEAKGVVDKLSSAMTHKETVKYMNERLAFLYPNKQSTNSSAPMRCEIDDDDLFGKDLGMPCIAPKTLL